MGTLIFVCPTTGHQVSTGVEVDRSSYKRLPRTKTAIFCPRCHKNHLLSRRVDHAPGGAHMLSLLPGDIKYESPSGNFRFYFPITTSIVISIVLTLVLWLFS